MHRGWIRLWRKWVDSPLAKDHEAFAVFMLILSEARHTPKTNPRYRYTVERGEIDLTLDQIGSKLGLSHKQTRNAVARLMRMECVTKRHTGGHAPTIWKVNNYGLYQPDGAPDVHTNVQPDVDLMRSQCVANVQLPKNEKNKSIQEDFFCSPSGEHETESEPAMTAQKPNLIQDRFDAFWANCPRKVGKQAALKAFKKLTAMDQDVAAHVMGEHGAIWQRADKARLEYCPHPATWLNAGRWHDDLADVKRMAGLGQSSTIGAGAKFDRDSVNYDIPGAIVYDNTNQIR